MEKVGSEEPVHFLLMNQEHVGAPPVRYPVPASIPDSWRKASIESTFLYVTDQDSRVPEITNILLQTTLFLGMMLALVEMMATHNSKTVFK